MNDTIEMSDLVESLKRNPVQVINDFNYDLTELKEVNPGVILACLSNYALQDSSIKTETLGEKGRAVNNCFKQLALVNEDFNDWLIDNIGINDNYADKIEEFQDSIPSSLLEYFNREDIIPLKENLIFVIKIAAIYALSDSTFNGDIGPRGQEANIFIKELFAQGTEDFIRDNIENYINPIMIEEPDVIINDINTVEENIENREN